MITIFPELEDLELQDINSKRAGVVNGIAGKWVRGTTNNNSEVCLVNRHRVFLLALFCIGALIFLTVGCAGNDEPEPAIEEPEDAAAEELTREEEIESIIRIRIDEGDYLSAELTEIRINQDMGYEGPDTLFIALIYFDYTISNTRDTANEMMRMYSDDLVATLANKGVQDVSEAAVFWKDDYNNRNLKYAYDYRDGGFYISDIAGE